MPETANTREEILKVTHDLINEGGVEAVNLRAVGKRAGLSRGAPYRHFENKEALLAAVVTRNFDILYEQIMAQTQVTKSRSDQLRLIMHAYYNFGVNNAAHYHLMFGTAWDPSTFPEVQRAAFRVFSLVSELIEQAHGKDSKVVSSLTEITAIMYAFLHGMVGLANAGHTEMSKGLHEPHQLMDQLLGLLGPFKEE